MQSLTIILRSKVVTAVNENALLRQHLKVFWLADFTRDKDVYKTLRHYKKQVEGQKNTKEKGKETRLE